MVSTNDRAREKYFRRMMINGTSQADSTRERIKVSQERAKAEGRPPGRPPALTPDQVNECKRMFAENPSVSRVARIRQSSMEVQQVVIYYAYAAHRVRWRFHGRATVHEDGPIRQEVMDRCVQAELDRDPERLGVAVLIKIDKITELSGEVLQQID